MRASGARWRRPPRGHPPARGRCRCFLRSASRRSTQSSPRSIARSSGSAKASAASGSVREKCVASQGPRRHVGRSRSAGACRTNVERYCRARLAQVILSREIERYRQENQGPLLATTSRLFSASSSEDSPVRGGSTTRDRAALVCVRATGAGRRRRSQRRHARSALPQSSVGEPSFAMRTSAGRSRSSSTTCSSSSTTSVRGRRSAARRAFRHACRCSSSPITRDSWSSRGSRARSWAPRSRALKCERPCEPAF